MGEYAHRNEPSASEPSDEKAHSLPEGVVTFLFSDIEGSTKLLQRAGDAYADLLGAHRRVMRARLDAHDGREVDTQGDSFFYAFSSPRAAVQAAADAQRALEFHGWPEGRRVRVRMGLHVGEPMLVDGHYVGIDVHRAARICSAAHGGQVLLSARLHDQVQAQQLTHVGFTDLGEHRLKDLAEPERLLQLDVDGMPHRFPPIRSLQRPTNLPHRVRDLVGRAREVEELRALLTEDGGARLVTITGPGGTGKTRLAIATAHSLLEQFANGAYFVDLTQVRESHRVVPALASELGLLLEGNQPAVDVVATHIGDRRMLLVLDNFEQVVEGAALLTRLIEACRRLRILVTSRRPLSLEDEQEYPLSPLRLPEGTALEDVRTSEAAQLFEERARLARPGFALSTGNAAAVAELCRMLEGLPLAIELAAARTKLLPPQALVDRLGDRLGLLTGASRDMPKRHRSLRSTIEWSYDLLSPDERAHFRDLAVFRGGARLESIEAVCGREQDAVSLVTGLVDHSLVRMREDDDGQPRFIMLETLREYADELLRQDPAHARELQERHAEAYRDVAVGASRAALKDAPDYGPVARDEANIRAALAHWLRADGADRRAAEEGLLLASAMGSYWYQHTQAVEGIGWLDRALAAVTDPPTEIEADARRWRGVLAEQQQDFDEARQQIERAMELYERIGNVSRVAACLNSLGVVSRSAGEVDRAEELLLAAVKIRREQGDEVALTSALNNLGIIYIDRGDAEPAKRIFSENLARDHAAKHAWGIACTSLNLAVAHVVVQEADDAEPLLRSCLTSYDDLGDLDLLIGALEVSVGVASARGQWLAGTRLAAAAAQARETLGVPAAKADLVHIQRWAGECAARLASDVCEAAQREGEAMTVEQARRYALDQVVLVNAEELPEIS